MRRTRVIALVLVSLCVASVTASASAAEGVLVNGEGNPLVKNSYKATGGRITIETAKGLSISCASSSAEGTVISTTRLDETATLSGCQDGDGAECNTAGEEGASVAMKLDNLPLPGKEGVIWAMALTAPVVIQCGGSEYKIRGAFVTSLGPEQERKLKTSFVFTASQEKGKQAPLELENEEEEARQTLEMSSGEGGYERAGQEGSEEVTFEEEAELR
jgi:hypothetical protein